MVYFAGRGKRKGEVELKLANRNLLDSLAKQAETEKDLNKLHEKEKLIVSEILANELVLQTIESNNAKLSDEEVADRLRKRGLIK